MRWIERLYSHIVMDMAYIHGTAAPEQDRLALLNRLTNRAFVEFLHIQPNTRILEIGSGLGILTRDVAAAAHGTVVVGLERSPQQIKAAVRARSNVEYVEGDAHELRFVDEAFDLVYARYVLEHVFDPARVVREMYRVTRAGGRVAVAENDISLLRTDPRCPTFERVWCALGRYQKMLGGDAFIGKRLYRLFYDAGFSKIELSVQPEVHWPGSPGFAGWIDNLVAIVEGAQAGLVDAGEVSASDVMIAISELESMGLDHGASCQFVWNRIMATR